MMSDSWTGWGRLLSPESSRVRAEELVYGARQETDRPELCDSVILQSHTARWMLFPGQLRQEGHLEMKV